MPPLAPRRRRRTSELKFCHTKRRRVSEALVERGIGKEFDRTLPFWRCFIDLRLITGRVPEVVTRHTQVLCRIPCKVFKRVDVVWARTTVQLRPVHAPTWQERKNGPRPPRASYTVPAKAAAERAVTQASATNGTPPSGTDGDRALRVYTIDTVHFVHEDAYKRGTGSDHSFHVQSVVLRDAPHILQCVGGSMVSFSLIIYTSLRLAHACDARNCTLQQLGRQLEAVVTVCDESSSTTTTESTSERANNASSAADATRTGQGADAAQQVHSTTQAKRASLARDSDFKSSSEIAAFSVLRAWCPPPTARILILGMGGNSMAHALRVVLGAEALIEVVEVEPAVVVSCMQMGTLHESDTKTKVHLQDADQCLATLPPTTYDFIYMDIFEPIQATMRNLHPWVLATRTLLKPGGLLVMNDHHLPSAAGVAPYAKVFGEGNVQAVNLRGWSESIVVCVAPGDAATDKYSLDVSKTHADIAFNIYETLVPGWLPHFSWLVKAKTYRHEGVRCRLWTS
ncbi:conserved hypothetical protein [Leishmania major strain Friedlin]|uniref:Spermidine synthase n=1 Tax=Leishmania major TaxID=5664 RepID=Q4Q0T3_LEIMA|nr:conserved hypothetical protein [Leishmania major strain Friedlin]CAG9584029.1 hypothetical_protein_-_conserved [Leishmania major strain Friedlin]CAJ09451.1 conserved hypothetical protein [Leishmania major strain Friedlin]|eukprot:XP_001687065.1 conserved hypothetical protein [Leishmania major strain Friedlin]